MPGCRRKKRLSWQLADLVGTMWYPSYLANSDLGSMAKNQSFVRDVGNIAGCGALMIQDDPTLTPNQVKCRLVASARAAVTARGHAAYGVFQQGAAS